MRQAGRVRLAELTAALSLATDLGTGQPMEHALRTCWMSLAVARSLGSQAGELSVVYYGALLRFLGCTSDASDTAVMAGGDEVAFNATMAPVYMGDAREAMPYFVRHLAEDLPLRRRLGRGMAAVGDPGGAARSLAGHCEVAARLATQIGLSEGVAEALAHAYERWDGKGVPSGLAGEAVPFAMRVVVVARDVELWSRLGGLEAVEAMLRRRRGHAYDPAVVDVLLNAAARLLADMESLDMWTAVVDAEPGPPAMIADDRLDEALAAVADFADLKSWWFRGHSRAVSATAAAAARACGLADADVVQVSRAALVHDLGAVGVPSAIWDRPGSLTSADWERVRLHPYLTERILARCAGLAQLGGWAGAHHERADASGYPKSSERAPLEAQLIAAADVYQALSEDRPHRPRFAPNEIGRLLVAEVDAGRLDRRAVEAVRAATGEASLSREVPRPAGLTEREVDVLRLIARGQPNKSVARELGISTKTVGHHIEHIYAKAGVSTRVGATLFAMEHDLLHP